MRRELEDWIVRDMLARTACALPCRKNDEPTELKLEDIEEMFNFFKKNKNNDSGRWSALNQQEAQ